MEWNEIAKNIDAFRYKFERSYKCINKDAVIKTNTLIHHIDIIVREYNNIVTLVNKYENRFTAEHREKCLRVLKSLNTRLISVANRRHIQISVPKNLNQLADFNASPLKDLDESIQSSDAESDSDIETL